MATVRLYEGESVENALKRFKKKLATETVISDMRRKEFYESPSVRKRKKREEARKRNNKKSHY